MNKDLLQLALDADWTTSEIKAGLIPTRALFTDVKELAYLSEIDELLKGVQKKTGIFI